MLNLFHVVLGYTKTVYALAVGTVVAVRFLDLLFRLDLGFGVGLGGTLLGSGSGVYLHHLVILFLLFLLQTWLTNTAQLRILILHMYYVSIPTLSITHNPTYFNFSIYIVVESLPSRGFLKESSMNSLRRS